MHRGFSLSTSLRPLGVRQGKEYQNEARLCIDRAILLRSSRGQTGEWQFHACGAPLQHSDCVGCGGYYRCHAQKSTRPLASLGRVNVPSRAAPSTWIEISRSTPSHFDWRLGSITKHLFYLMTLPVALDSCQLELRLCDWVGPLTKRTPTIA